MADVIHKILDCEVKKLGERQYEFTASTSSQDRDGEIIEPSGWDVKNFKKNPVIMYAHDYKSLPIGRAPKVWVSTNGELKNTIEFPPEGTYEFADIVERLVNAGYLRTESVGFLPRAWVDGDGEKEARRTYTKQELLEISIVPVPSNPDALRNAVDEGVITVKELNVITKPEETEDYIHIPVRECEITATIDISKKEGIKARYCGEEKQVGTYMFDKRDPYNWTMAKAKKWVEEHKQVDEIKDEPPQKKAITQAEINDELDYIIKLIHSEGMNEEVTEEAWNMVREVMRLTGDDIPDDIQDKIGAVLNQKNRQRLKDIKIMAQQILDSAGAEEEPKQPELSQEDIVQIVRSSVVEAIDKAQGKV